MYYCPNCGEKSSVSQESCFACNADFSSPEGWKPVPRDRLSVTSATAINLGFTAMQRCFGTWFTCATCDALALAIGAAAGVAAGVGCFWLIGAISGYSLLVGALLAPPLSVAVGCFVWLKLGTGLSRSFKASLQTHSEA